MIIIWLHSHLKAWSNRFRVTFFNLCIWKLKNQFGDIWSGLIWCLSKHLTFPIYFFKKLYTPHLSVNKVNCLNSFVIDLIFKDNALKFFNFYFTFTCGWGGVGGEIYYRLINIVNFICLLHLLPKLFSAPKVSVMLHFYPNIVSCCWVAINSQEQP